MSTIPRRSRLSRGPTVSRVCYENVSYWLEDVGELTPRPQLQGSVHADVAIVGAGYTGLWTAYYLQRRRPGLRVVVVDSEIAGFGASGRNGGWCNSSMIGVSPGEMERRYGAEATSQVFGVLRETVSEVGRVCEGAGIDVAWRPAGVLRLAVGEHELPALHARWQTLQRLGLAEGCALLDRGALERRVRVADARGAVFDPHVAFHHPGRLTRGLARHVEQRGATIYERSPVVAYELGDRPRLVTPAGEVRADTVVLAGGAFLTRFGGWRRRMLPVYSLVVLTEPLSEAQWQEVGWADGECLSSHALTVDYVTRTHDGRVLFGGRGVPYHFGSRVAAAFDRDVRAHANLRARFRRWFPALHDVRFTHAWGGPLGVTRDWMPVFVHDRTLGVATCYGYAGQGVAPSNLAGRMLADSIAERSGSPLLELPLAQHRVRRWEPEPLRWLGVRFVQRRLAAIDRRGERTGKAPRGRSLAERLSRH